MFLRIDKLQIELPRPERVGPGVGWHRAGVDGRQVRRDVHPDELHLPVVQHEGQEQDPALLRSRGQHRRRGDGPHRVGCQHHQPPARPDRGEQRRGRTPPELYRHDRQPRPFRKLWSRYHTRRRGRQGVDGRLRLQHRKPQARPASQFLPRIGREDGQDQGLRSDPEPGGPRDGRVPYRTRRRPPGGLRQGALRSLRRRGRDQVVARTRNRSATSSPTPESTWTRASTASCTASAPRTTGR